VHGSGGNEQGAGSRDQGAGMDGCWMLDTGCWVHYCALPDWLPRLVVAAC